MLKGPGTINFLPPTAQFQANFELRDKVTLPLPSAQDALGNLNNSLIFGAGGGTVEMNSLQGGTLWGNPVVINGDANFHDVSFNGTDIFGTLTGGNPNTTPRYIQFGVRIFF